MGKINVIKIGRTKKGLNQQEFADILNVTRQTVSNWETNKQAPDVHQLVQISLQLDITLDDLAKHFKKKEGSENTDESNRTNK